MYLTVVILESRQSTIQRCETDGSEVIKLGASEDWDSSKYLIDNDGRRLFEEIIRRVRSFWDKNPGPTEGVALTLPGTLADADTIISSSRLGIRDRVYVSQILSGGLGVPCKAFHDVECLAIGEDQQASRNANIATKTNNTLVYIFAEEGIGSKIIINGTTYTGAGVAGLLGRLTVQPDGSYFRALAARGPLEVFSSRPWVSENLVGTYMSEQDKQGASPEALERTKFRRALRVAAGGDWRSIDYGHIADGIANQDPIAVSVLDVAARYLGFAINSVITILHPHRIVLGGAMFTRLPGFADQVTGYARRYSWPNAWNSITLTVSSLGRQAQVYGAVEMWVRTSLH